MKRVSINRRTLGLVAFLAPMLLLFVYVALRSGPLAPVPVTVTQVENRSIAPALFGIGTVEARYTYRIGPTIPGRVKRVEVHVGDRVKSGQLLGEMEPVDLDDRINAQLASLKRAESSILAAEAQVEDALARQSYARKESKRYEQLLTARTVSEEAVEAKRQELKVAEAGLATAQANLNASRQELLSVQANLEGLRQQRENMRLISPVDGLVTIRNADPGTTVVAGQSVVEVIDHASLWINVRFDQLGATGLQAGLPAQITLRSQSGYPVNGRVFRIEPVADAITEEILAKVTFDGIPETLPPVGELAEVTVALPTMEAAPVVPNASIQRLEGRTGVWIIDNDRLQFAPVKMGVADLDGQIQILEGLKPGERIVLYSQRVLKSHDRVKIVDQLVGGST
ncbi:MAG: efflux transporter periplasmic adaptor subunit [Sedimenticola sp.]|nr:MAG: efflux transporter periplasmic adaptor subunit [Sedimenticola sp.]